MHASAEILAPPEGLDLDEIATDAGLLGAIQREAVRLDEAQTLERRLSRDEVRLIAFLAGEVRRRIDDLSPEEKEEFRCIRTTARERETERNVRDLVGDVERFVAEVEKPRAAVLLSRVSELEIRAQGMQRHMDKAFENSGRFIEELTSALNKLEAVKRKGLKGFEEFD